MKPLALISLLALAALATAPGCQDAAESPTDPVAVDTPGLLAEPPFTGGETNTVAWTDTGADSYRVDMAADMDFASVEASSDWTTATTWTFTGLEHGTTYYFRVQARDPEGNTSPWSQPQASTQDAVPPVTGIAPTPGDQTSLRFTLVLEGQDDLSGITEIDLWYTVDQGPMTFEGTYSPGNVVIVAEESGFFRFYTTGVDAAGNRSSLPDTAQVVTQVPEPIIITDVQGEDFDITNAVLKHHLAATYWAHGVGRNTIRPVIDPRMIGPGDPGYPDDDEQVEVIGVAMGDDIRAYKIIDIPDREVVDDVVNGAELAVTY